MTDLRAALVVLIAVIAWLIYDHVGEVCVWTVGTRSSPSNVACTPTLSDNGWTTIEFRRD